MILSRVQLVVLTALGLGLPIAAPAATPAAAAEAGRGRGLVIVAPAALQEVLGEYLAYKAAQRPAELVALEDVLQQQLGEDDAERLKRFLYQRWSEDQFGYVLLIGDVDVMPVRYMVLDRVTPAACDYAFYPSDLYYADLAKADGSFEDWNACREGYRAGYFGEVRGEKNKDDPINADQIDYLPEIAVGRWPVSTAEQAALVARKTIRYEQGLLNDDKPGARVAGLLAVQGWVDSRRLLDGVARDLAARWEVSNLYYPGGNWLDTTPPTEAALYALLNAGAGLVMHTGHGEANRWDHCCTAGGLAKVQNADRLPVLVSAGCSTAYFAPLPPYGPYTDVHGEAHRGTDHGQVFSAPPPPPAVYQRQFNGSGLGEAALRDGENGAVAYIGCNTGSQPCALTLLAGFAQTLATDPQPTLGDAWIGGLRYYHARERLAELQPTSSWYPPSVFFQGMKFMVFGVPTLPLPADR